MSLRYLVLLALASCTTVSADAKTRSPAPARESLAAAFGIDRVETSCRAIEFHAGDAKRTRSLDVDIDAQKLHLRAGTHRLRPGSDVRVEIREYAGSRRGETDCTDAGTPDQPVETARWTATGGELVVTLSADAKLDRSFSVDAELVDVVFRNASGVTKRVHARFDDLNVGWLPG
ncbi:MAG TPA: hypothetical protein VG755_16245 [Nannocystaceae bacterium]|nr:hypothetical protein [Nannocystaceae bacterium]